MTNTILNALHLTEKEFRPGLAEASEDLTAALLRTKLDKALEEQKNTARDNAKLIRKLSDALFDKDILEAEHQIVLDENEKLAKLVQSEPRALSLLRKEFVEPNLIKLAYEKAAIGKRSLHESKRQQLELFKEGFQAGLTYSTVNKEPARSGLNSKHFFIAILLGAAAAIGALAYSVKS